MTQIALLLGRPLRIEQANNTRRNVFLEIDGERMTRAEACRRFGVSKACLKYRMNAGWDAARAVTEPSSRRGGRHAFA